MPSWAEDTDLIRDWINDSGAFDTGNVDLPEPDLKPLADELRAWVEYFDTLHGRTDHSQYIKSYHYPVWPSDDPIHQEFSDLDNFIEIFRWKETDTYILRRRGGDGIWSIFTEQWEWPDRETLHAHQDDYLLGLDDAFVRAEEVAALERVKDQRFIDRARQQRVEFENGGSHD